MRASAQGFRTRLRRFVEALQVEIAWVANDQEKRSLKLKSGERDRDAPGPGEVFVFVRAGWQGPIPDDAPALLRYRGRKVPVTVVGHEDDRIWLRIEDSVSIAEPIADAWLEFDETQLLERLKDSMEALAEGGRFGLGPKVFGDEPSVTGTAPLAERLVERVDEEAMRRALEQANESEVTFLWGPPGTGKTFSIAGLVTTLVEAGESVLVTSHTHAAVEQALWAGIEPETDGRPPGLLAGSPLIEAGEILKFGALRDSKIPVECHLDDRVRGAQEERAAELDRATEDLRRARQERDEARRAHSCWERLDHAEAAYSHAAWAAQSAAEAQAAVNDELEDAEVVSESTAARLRRARSSFFVGRKRRVERAERALALAQGAVAEVRQRIAGWEHEARDRRRAHAEAAGEVAWARREAESVGERELVSGRYEVAQARVAELAALVEELQHLDRDLVNELLDGAKALFVTLTKLYVDPKLGGRSWDTVIIDEASMAMPPLVALAAAQARRRVVICGDFWQLPPIVHSKSEVVGRELATDVFHVRGIPEALQREEGVPELACLSMQRRMHPQIAGLARVLAYGDRLVDHADVRDREPPPWLDVPLGGEPFSPVIVVDTAGTGGRCSFPDSRRSSPCNHASAEVSLAVAAMLGARAPKPEPGDAQRIGIITPYRVQRNHLARLLASMGDLAEQVGVGTVHTFQGNECDVVVLDTVVAEPLHRPLLIDPASAEEFRRLFNVAVTRARHQLVLVGDAAWLDKPEHTTGALGLLWKEARRVAPVIPAASIPAPLNTRRGQRQDDDASRRGQGEAFGGRRRP